MVNGATAGLQNFVSSARLTNGNVVATWRTDQGDGDVRARLLSPAGTPVGAEFAVNSDAAGIQMIPTVAALPGGGFVIAWTSGPTTRKGRIVGQIFSAAGGRVGAEFSYDESENQDSVTPHELNIAPHADGSFTLNSLNVQPRVFGGSSVATVLTRAVSAQGVPGPPLLFWARGRAASDPDPFIIGLLDSARLTSGNFVLGFTLGSQIGPQLRFRLFAPPTRSLGENVLVGNEVTLEHSILALPDGGFLIARRVAPETLKVSRFDAAGAAMGSEIVVGTGSASSLGLLADGRVAIAFEGPEPAGGGGRDIYAATFTPAGALSAIVLVNQATAGNQTYPRLEATSGGGFMVLWNDGATGDVKARAFTG